MEDIISMCVYHRVQVKRWDVEEIKQMYVFCGETCVRWALKNKIEILKSDVIMIVTLKRVPIVLKEIQYKI